MASAGRLSLKRLPSDLPSLSSSSSPISPSLRLPQIRSKMTSGPLPPPVSVAPEATAQTPAALPSSVVDSSNVFSPSSPIQPKSHPFLRKFQSYGIATGSSAFSTSATSSGQDSSDGSSGRKSVDEAIASVAAGNVGNKSPTAAAANATDAIINKRLGHYQAGTTEGASTKDGCCSGAHASDDAYFNMDASHLPPVSAEARRFSEQLLGQNKAWAIKTEEERPGFFAKLEKQQKPQVLWIGKCNGHDSR